jgi:hypothetical protein
MTRRKRTLRDLRGSFRLVPSRIVEGRIVLALRDGLPCRSGLDANAHALAR